MYLRTLKLTNFRNFTEQSVTFAPATTAIVGPNAQGKTNLLEAIFMLVLTKSFRTSNPRELVNWEVQAENKFSIIHGEFDDAGTSKTLEVILDNRKTFEKQVKINGAPGKTIDFVGMFNAVLFLPDDLNLISDSPSLRRRYVDVVLSQVCKPYLYSLARYNKVLHLRNKILANIRDQKAHVDELGFWDKELVDHASIMIKYRFQMLDFFNQQLSIHYQELSGDAEAFKLSYISCVDSERDIATMLRTSLKKRLERDIQVGSTSVGPHREDFVFELNQRPLASFGSRGECRTAILALKLTEMEYLKQQSGRNPVLLLDDVFSELDESRRAHLLKHIQGHQTIITTTDAGHLKDAGPNVQFLYLSEGILLQTSPLPSAQETPAAAFLSTGHV